MINNTELSLIIDVLENAGYKENIYLYLTKEDMADYCRKTSVGWNPVNPLILLTGIPVKITIGKSSIIIDTKTAAWSFSLDSSLLETIESFIESQKESEILYSNRESLVGEKVMNPSVPEPWKDFVDKTKKEKFTFSPGQIIKAQLAGSPLSHCFHLYEVISCNYGATNQESVIGIQCLSHSDPTNNEGKYQKELLVPVALLEAVLESKLVNIVDVTKAASRAVEYTGNKDSIFTLSNFNMVSNTGKMSAAFTTLETEKILSNSVRVVRLSGGSHWLLLPGDHRRF